MNKQIYINKHIYTYAYMINRVFFTYICMYICTKKHTNMYVHMYEKTHEWTCLHICTYIYVHMYTCVYIYIYTLIIIHVYTYVHIYIRTYIHVHMYTCVYIYIYALIRHHPQFQKGVFLWCIFLQMLKSRQFKSLSQNPVSFLWLFSQKRPIIWRSLLIVAIKCWKADIRGAGAALWKIIGLFLQKSPIKESYWHSRSGRGAMGWLRLVGTLKS